jgi:predicted nucleotidyltransferase
MIGLDDKTIHLIGEIEKMYPNIEQIILFGSRAMGNHKPGSDVDLALKGNHLTTEICIQINVFLNEKTSSPYYFDVINYETLSDISTLKKHIDTFGEIIMSKKSKA